MKKARQKGSVPIPVAPRRPTELSFHGERIVDPYLWLEDGDDAEVQAWWEAQDAHTRRELASYPGRDRLERRLEELFSVRILTPPVPRGGRLFLSMKLAGAQQPRLLVHEEGQARLLVDPELEDPDGLTAVDWWRPSPTGRYLVVVMSHAGTERGTLTVRRSDTGEVMDVIPLVRAPTVAWLVDESGFYYTRMPRPGTVPPGEEEYHRDLYFHRLGSDPDGDPEVFGQDRDMTEHYEAEVSKDGRYLVLSAMRGLAIRNEIWVANLADHPPGFARVTPDEEALFHPVLLGETLYLHTNLDADRWKVNAVPLAEAGRRPPETVVREDQQPLLEVYAAGGRLLLHYLDRGISLVRLWDPGDGRLGRVDLPDHARVAEWTTGADPESTSAYLQVSGFTLGPQVLEVDVQSGRIDLFEAVELPCDLSQFVQERRSYRSPDGTEVLLWLIHRKGLTGPVPAVLAGYGGFGIAYPTSFAPQIVPWLEAGGLYAVAHLRGGGEHGAAWHRAGMRDGKQHVIDDFLAAAQYLVAQGWTSPDRLGIYGRSNGGLLIGAAITQRPEMFRAAVVGVPLLDMLRYQERLIARLWIPEYGTAESREDFHWLHGYSPYHRVAPGTHYPAVLLFTAEGDSRVDPMHARKMAAVLQWATGSERPIYLRVERPAGHGVGKPVRLQVAEWTDTWSFLMWELGVAAL